MEWILPQRIPCQDPMSKSQTQQFWESPDQLLVLTLSVTDLCWLQPIHVQHSQVFCSLQAFLIVVHFQQILDHLWSICATVICTALIASSPKAWIIWIVSTEEYSSLMQNLIQIHCSTHSVILNVMATQYTCPLNGVYHPLTSTVKSPLFRHVHSSPLSLASRLHWCWANCSLYINNGWAFSGQTLVYSVIFPEEQREYISLQLNYLKMLF